MRLGRGQEAMMTRELTVLIDRVVSMPGPAHRTEVLGFVCGDGDAD